MLPIWKGPYAAASAWPAKSWPAKDISFVEFRSNFSGYDHHVPKKTPSFTRGRTDNIEAKGEGNIVLGLVSLFQSRFSRASLGEEIFPWAFI
jgi:hypothetical protein